MPDFNDFVGKNYSLPGAAIGRPLSGGKVAKGLEVSVPFSSFTRHGLVAGSTGTGKSRAVQKIIEKLSKEGIPVFLSDVKGDVSGFCVPGGAARAEKRAEELGCEWSPRAFPAVYWSVSDRFVPLRFRVSDVGAVLFSRLLGLNPVQESHLNIAFIYAEQNAQDLVFLDDLKKVLEFLKAHPEEVSGTSPQAINVILRKLSELSAGPGGKMFGEPAIELKDAMKGGRINVLSLSDAGGDNVSALASAFLLHKFFKELPEIGEVEKPGMVFFLDEAHVLFKEANKTLVDLVTTILRRIRSKGVGVFFITQDALDLPSPVLKLLGTKIQFAMRAFTKKELGDMKAVAESFPQSDYYDVREEIKALSAGQSFVSLLGGNGESLPAVKVAWYPPESLIDAPDEEALEKAVGESGLRGKYAARQKQTALAEFLKSKPAKAEARQETEKPAKTATEKPGREGAGGALGKTILRIFWVAMKAVETFLYFVAYKPGKWFLKWVARKPKRIAWVVFFILLALAVFRYWPQVSAASTAIVSLLDKLVGG